MPYRTSYRPDLELGIVFLSGVITAKTLGRALADLVSSSEWRHGYHTLWSGMMIDEIVITPEALNDLVALGDRLQDHIGPGREAIVIESETSRTCAALFALTDDAAIRQRNVFHATEPALRWLIRNNASRPAGHRTPGQQFAA